MDAESLPLRIESRYFSGSEIIQQYTRGAILIEKYWCVAALDGCNGPRTTSKNNMQQSTNDDELLRQHGDGNTDNSNENENDTDAVILNTNYMQRGSIDFFE